MNPWDNFLLELQIGIPGYVMVAITLLILWRQSKRLPSDDYTDDRYEDGFYVPKEQT